MTCSAYAATGCHSAHALDGFRQRHQLNGSFEFALACHLSRPCRTCLDRLHGLPRLAPPEAGPGQRVDLADTKSVLIRALRTLGGWPPGRWLQAERRRALAAVGEPFGFLWLVLEEARHTERAGLGVELPRWVERVQQIDGARGHRCQSAPVLARALCYLAVAEHSPRRSSVALDLFDRAAAVIDDRPRDVYLAALSAETHGRLLADRRPGFAQEQFELAADFVVLHNRERWAEIQLARGRLLLAAGGPEAALDLADEVEGGFIERDAPLVRRSLRLLRAQVAQAAVTASTPGLPRLLRGAELAAVMEPAGPIAPEFDAELCHKYARLVCQLEEVDDQHRPIWLRDVDPIAFDGPVDEALFTAVLAALDPERTSQHRERLAELAGDPEIARALAEGLAEIEAVRQSTAEVRGVPELLGPVAEVLRSLNPGSES